MAEFKITQENFKQEVLQAQEPVLIDFWAEWCGPCRMLGPVIAEIAADYEGRVKVGKINVDEEQTLAASFQVASIPTLLLFKGGKNVDSSIGFCPKEQIAAMLDKALS